jgi:hypothetical protein
MDVETREALNELRSSQQEVVSGLNNVIVLLQGLTRLALADMEEIEDDGFPEVEGNA